MPIRDWEKGEKVRLGKSEYVVVSTQIPIPNAVAILKHPLTGALYRFEAYNGIKKLKGGHHGSRKNRL